MSWSVAQEQAARVTVAVRQHVPKIPAAQQRHDDEGSPFVFAELKDRADVGMIQRRHGAAGKTQGNLRPRCTAVRSGDSARMDGDAGL
jgi:hypothetical protein